jgi:hypothetical protein
VIGTTAVPAVRNGVVLTGRDATTVNVTVARRSIVVSFSVMNEHYDKATP